MIFAVSSLWLANARMLARVYQQFFNVSQSMAPADRYVYEELSLQYHSCEMYRRPWSASQTTGSQLRQLE